MTHIALEGRLHKMRFTGCENSLLFLSMDGGPELQGCEIAGNATIPACHNIREDFRIRLGRIGVESFQ